MCVHHVKLPYSCDERRGVEEKQNKQKKQNKTPPLLLVWVRNISDDCCCLMGICMMYSVTVASCRRTRRGRPRKYCDILCSSICGIALCWRSQSKCWNAFQGTALYWARKYFVFVLMWILFFGLFVCLFFHKVKVYSFGHCSWSYSKVVLVLTGFFVCTYTVYSMCLSPWWLNSSPFSPAVLRYNSRTPLVLDPRVCLCVSVYILFFFFLKCLSASLKTCKFIIVKISRTCFWIGCLFLK